MNVSRGFFRPRKHCCAFLVGLVFSYLQGGESFSPNLPKITGEKLAELLQMDSQEIKSRMMHIFDFIDADKDGIISLEEVQEWVKRLKKAMHSHQMTLEFQSIDKNGDGKVTLEELEATYTEGVDKAQLEEHKEEVRKRFVTVDKDGDGSLNMEEISILMDPSKDDALLQIEVDEIFKTQDKDGDRAITLKEFLEVEGASSLGPAEKEELEKEFKNYDINGDGKIDEEELKKVIIDPHAHEIKAMIDDFAKEMEDGKLSKEKWESSYEHLSTSVLTDNGEVLRFPEDYKGIEFPFKSIVPKTAEEISEEEDEEEKHEEL